MAKLTLLCISLAVIHVQAVSNDWWKDAIIYQIYPRSFKDSNGDGIGDLNGIASKLEHVKDIGASAFWLSPIYTSPQVDFGYDVANFTDVDPAYGTLHDFDKLVAKAKSLGLKVILDFVPNHSSNEHPWFKMSVKRKPPYDRFYVWMNAKIVNGTRQPPNNWLSAFGGSAWEWNEHRRQYYLHQFAIGQPDLNYRNQDTYRAMTDVLFFWMDRGVDGFRIDAVNHLFEDAKKRDEPRNNNQVPDNDYDSLDHIYTKDQSETFQVLRDWRRELDKYAEEHKTDGKFIVTEAYVGDDEYKKYFKAGSNPFNFAFISSLNKDSSAKNFMAVIEKWIQNVPFGKVSNWVTGNHDQHRLVTRFGSRKADMVLMLSMFLKGFCVVYNGDEIGMVDKFLTWEETKDISGCNAGPDRYFMKSRDPERTPFQWDNTTSAGFSSNEKTWLPVHENYKTLNLAAQKEAKVSNYKFFKTLTALRKKYPVLKYGKYTYIIMGEHIWGIVKGYDGPSPVALLLNTGETEVVFKGKWVKLPQRMIVHTSNVESNIKIGSSVDTTALKLPPVGSVILVPSA